ncbi:MAG: adenylate/guanylate cyclase domain-containing protein, partial [Spartobacteria bacterium]|nr:adenylate/guanylate cyclase domain-containing protein [Spartobacteria bacterium]
RAALFRVFDGQVAPALGLAPLFAGASPGNPAMARISRHAFSWGDASVPVDREGRMILHYRGPVSVYAPYSAAAIIQSELRLLAGEAPSIDPEVFRDAYVFFGFSAPGLLDLRPTPVSSVSPGVMVYATMLDNLLMRDAMRMAPVWLVILAVALGALGCSLAVVLARRVWHSVLAGFFFLAASFIWAFWSYAWGLWFPLVAQAGAVLAAFGIAMIFNYATEGRQKAFIKKAFRHYLSPAVIDDLLKNHNQLKLGGERRELTIFFSDLQGFSGISERLDPRQLTALLNDFLSDMTDIILEEGGTLDKYEGDAIIAFWNAPLHQPDHAIRACRAVLRCQRKLDERRKEFEERTGVSLYQRIGLNTGEVVVGNMGSSKRFDYTVLGDAANLASRLEGANKAFGTYTMISESTWNLAKTEFLGREIGLLRVVGRKTPVRVYELLGLAGEQAALDITAYEAGIHLCQAGQGDRALEALQAFNDVVSMTYKKRLESREAAGWDGIWNLTEK